jgi:hypothetical protein
VWQRELPDGGQPANATQRSYELQVSHWTGDLPVLWLKWDWIYNGRFDHLYGKLTYRGNPVYGFGASTTGNPEDSFGRNIYVDTHKPPWRHGYKQAGGWYRWNGFLAKRPLGNFCAGVYSNQYGRAVPGRGNKYRAIAMGPGVTPIVMWQGPPPGYYAKGGFPEPGSTMNYDVFPSVAPKPAKRGPFSGTSDWKMDQEEQNLALQAGPGTKSSTCANVHDGTGM